MSRKNHIKLTTYYNIGAVLPFALSLLAGLFLSASHEQDPKYVSEYFKDDGFNLTIVFHILLSLLIAVCSLPIFLNVYKKIADHFLNSLLTWFLLPASLLAYSFYQFIQSPPDPTDKLGESDKLDYFFTLIVLSHLLALIISFIQFRRVLYKIKTLIK